MSRGTIPGRSRNRRDARSTALHAHPDGGLAQRAIAPEPSTRLCLDDDALHNLHRLATRCEALFDGPQNIEWAFVGPDLYLLQSRPVTRVGGHDGWARKIGTLADATRLGRT